MSLAPVKEKIISIQKRSIPILFIAPTLIVILFVIIYPLFYSFFLTFHKFTIGMDSPRYIGLRNYVSLFSDTRLLHSLYLSIAFTCIALILEFLIGLGLALLVDKVIRGRSMIISILIIPMGVMPVVIGLVWRMLYHPSYGVVNHVLTTLGFKGPLWLASTRWALPALILSDIWQWTPYIFLVILAGLQSLPKEPFEAAKIDGASSWQMFHQVCFPLLRPVILVVLLLRAMDLIKEFDKVYTLTGGGPGSATEIMSYYVYKIGFKYFKMGYGATCSFLILFVIAALSFILIKTWSSKVEL